MELLKSTTGRILIESHRGAEALAPENSWPALLAGCAAGADLIEIDIQLSSDGVAFLHHNYTLPASRWCARTSWDEMKDIRIKGEPLPLLEDVLIWAREKQVNLSLDLKVGFMPERRLATEVLRLVKRTRTEENIMLICWDHVELWEIKQAHPAIRTRALLRGRLLDYAAFIHQTRVDAISMTYGVVRPSDIEQIHQAGAAALLGEMWQPDFEMARQLDVDIISWSDPAAARKMLESI